MSDDILREGVATGMRFSRPGQLSIAPKAPPSPKGAPSPLSVAEQELLVLQHLPLVRALARHHVRRCPPSVQAGDLESVGTLGLIEAARRFQPSAGVLFATFAEFRIRGAIVDDMRRGATYTREQHRKLEAGEDATPRVMFDSRLTDACEAPPVEEGPDLLMTPKLRSAVALLPRRWALLLVWRFWHGLTLKQCSARMGVNESRASQLQTAALDRLRAIIEAAQS